MERYIDADKLIEHLKDEIKACEPKFGGRVNGKSVAYGTELGLKSAISFAETLATADVVPKSEVEELERDRYRIFPDGRVELLPRTDIGKIKREVAREIFAEIEKVIGDKYESYVFDNNDLDSIEQDAIINFSDNLSDSFEEIKKKYMEEKE